MTKLVSEIAGDMADGLGLVRCDPKNVYTAVMVDGRPVSIDPTPGSEVKCPMCSGARGMLILDPMRKIWSCINFQCIRRNSSTKPRVNATDTRNISLSQVGCHPDMADASLSSVELTEGAAEAIINWQRNPGNLLIYGNPGSGKTYMAAAITRHWLDEGRGTAIFRSIDQIFNTWHQEVMGVVDRVLAHQLSERPLLVIDDLGSRELSEKFLSWLQVILGARHDGRRPTIVTSNLAPEDVRRNIGEPNWSRLHPTSIPMFFDDKRLIERQA